MVKRLLLVLLFGAWLFNYGCSTLEKINVTKPPAPPPPPKMVYPFSDIPYPQGYSFDSNKSFVYESGSGAVKVGRFIYSGWSDFDGVVNFYENEMLNKGWKLVNAIKHETTVLNYQKEGWVCTVMMSSKMGQVFIEIQAGPK